jgi:hypothetical protein
MKGFAITLVILIILAAVGFFLGWVQFQVDDGEYAVLFTKTAGWEPEVIYPGTFVWRWQGMFPTMLRRYDFSRTVRDFDIRIEDSLPGSDLYADYVADDPDFSWNVRVYGRFAILPDALPALASDQGLRPADIEDFLDGREMQIRSQISSALPSLISDLSVPERASPAIMNLPELRRRLDDILTGRFSELEFDVLVVTEARLPDIELYLTARQRYLSLLDSEAAARQAALGELARLDLINQAQQESLEVLGSILESNPSLLEYLRIISETGRDPIGLSPLFADVLGNALTLDGLNIPAAQESTP